MRMVRWNPTATCNTVVNSSENSTPFLGLMNDFLTRDNMGNSLNVDIFEKEDSYVLTAELPGVKKEDLVVNVEGDVLTVEAEKKFEDKAEATYYTERRYGKFSRSFRLNGQVDNDKIGAAYGDGILRLTLPKREEVKGRQISIK